MCCLHHVIEADGGSHHVCGTTDDLEGELVLGAALLVPALVPGRLLACEGGAELQAMGGHRLCPGGAEQGWCWGTVPHDGTTPDQLLA